MKSTDTGLKRILKAFGYSWAGFTATFKSESAFRQDILFCLIMTAALFFLPVKGVKLVLLILPLFLILITELVNTAIECVIDRIGSEYHILSKKAKDIGSLLVLISFIYWAVSWGIILFPILIGAFL